MFKNLPKTLAALGITALMAGPALSQMQISLPFPRLEVRVAHQAPPPLRYERVSSRPYRDAVWVPGSWDWQGDQWVWVSGRWDRPEQRGARWVNARYQRDGDGWRYEPAHWSTQRVVEGDDYRRWRDEHRRDRDWNR